MTRRDTMSLLIGVGVAMLSGCTSILSGKPSYRVRMTVETMTPQGQRIGSSVMEINAYEEDFVIGDRGGGHSGLTGEAVVVDQPDGPIFVLLKEADQRFDLHSEITKALAPEARSGTFADYLKAVKKLASASMKVTADLPRKSWPMMVRFADTHKPATVDEVNPNSIGVVRIWLETTAAPITTGLARRLPWLPAHQGALVYDRISQVTDHFHPAKNLDKFAFANGLFK